MGNSTNIENAIYTNEYYQSALAQKKRILLFAIILSVIYLAIGVGLIIYYTTLPYKSPTITLVKVILYVITAIYGVFIFLYMAIKFRRINKYCAVLKGIMVGDVISGVGSFICYNESIEVKDGCDFKSMIFSQWSSKKQEYFERKVLVDVEKEFPVIKENEIVKDYTHANILVGYELLDEK